MEVRDFFTIEEMISTTKRTAVVNEIVADNNLTKCPSCGKATLKIEGGCNTCINEDCGFSKCDI